LLSLASFAKVISRKSEKTLDYTPPKNVLEELKILEKQKGWAIFESVKILMSGKADSFSFTKDNPYNYFYARVTDEDIIFKMKTREDETEFKISLQEFNDI
jgi:hypothetical protein